MEFLGGLHPMVIHFPIVFFIVYCLLEIIGVIINNEKLLQIAYFTLIAGIVTALGAVLTGNQAEEFAERLYNGSLEFPHEAIELHEKFATLSLWFFTLVAVFRTYLKIKKKFKGRIRYFFIIFAVVGAYLIFKAGTAGGELVYKHGVGTNLTIPQDNRLQE
ncbi:MAG: DUF2231 domain-containing protein [Bacteroidetes bacterium]|nr:DUF2231 domain-containing protein [Bacteroidota bacterium]